MLPAQGYINLPFSLLDKMSDSKLIHYFVSHLATFGCWASTPMENVVLKKTDQSLLDFQTSISAAAHANME